MKQEMQLVTEQTDWLKSGSFFFFFFSIFFLLCFSAKSVPATLAFGKIPLVLINTSLLRNFIPHQAALIVHTENFANVWNCLPPPPPPPQKKKKKKKPPKNNVLKFKNKNASNSF